MRVVALMESKRARLALAMLMVALALSVAELVAPGLALAQEGLPAGDRELPTAAIVGIVVSFGLAVLLLLIALPFLLPKPPGK